MRFAFHLKSTGVKRPAYPHRSIAALRERDSLAPADLFLYQTEQHRLRDVAPEILCDRRRFRCAALEQFCACCAPSSRNGENHAQMPLQGQHEGARRHLPPAGTELHDAIR
jgi:hypothetical protein